MLIISMHVRVVRLDEELGLRKSDFEEIGTVRECELEISAFV